MKTCKQCNENKDENDFGIQGKPDGNNFKIKKLTYHAYCKVCMATRAREWRKIHKNYRGTGAYKQYPKEDRLLVSAIGSRLTDAKQRARKYSQDVVQIDKKYLYTLAKKQQMCCALTGESMTLITNRPDTISLDKIDPKKGYIEGNVQWLCWAVNRAKGDLTTEVFINMCTRITRRCNDYPEKEYSQVAGSAQPQEIE